MQHESDAYQRLRWSCFSTDRDAHDGPEAGLIDALTPDERHAAEAELTAGLRDDDPRPALALAELRAVRSAPHIAVMLDAARGREAEAHARASVDIALALWTLAQDPAAIEHTARVVAQNSDTVIRMIAAANLGQMRHARSIEVIGDALLHENDAPTRYNLARSAMRIYGFDEGTPETDAQIMAATRASGYARPAARDALFAWISSHVG